MIINQPVYSDLQYHSLHYLPEFIQYFFPAFLLLLLHTLSFINGISDDLTIDSLTIGLKCHLSHWLSQSDMTTSTDHTALLSILKIIDELGSQLLGSMIHSQWNLPGNCISHILIRIDIDIWTAASTALPIRLNIFRMIMSLLLPKNVFLNQLTIQILPSDMHIIEIEHFLPFTASTFGSSEDHWFILTSFTTLFGFGASKNNCIGHGGRKGLTELMIQHFPILLFTIAFHFSYCCS